MRKKILLSAVVSLSLFLASCQKEDSPIFLSVSAVQSVVETCSWIQFSLSFKSDGRVLSDCVVTSYDDNYGNRVLDTISIGRAEYNETFFTLAPLTADTLLTKYTFRVRDDAGRDARFVYEIVVLPSKDKIPEELSAIELFADSTGKCDGFAFSTRQPVYTPDSRADFRVTMNAGALCFKTDTNVMFVRENSFDYSAATEHSIWNAYVNSIRTSSVPEVRQGDVILVGRIVETEETPAAVIALGAMKILITDGKRIIFNIKLVSLGEFD